MILLDVKHYLKEKSVCNLQVLSLHFQCEPETMRCMLQHWIRKGVIASDAKPAGCGVKCIQCQPAIAEVYRYLG